MGGCLNTITTVWFNYPRHTTIPLNLSGPGITQPPVQSYDFTQLLIDFPIRIIGIAREPFDANFASDRILVLVR